MKKYAIWDKVSPVITPNGKLFSAEEWMGMYPAARLNNIVVVCSAGEINGGFFGTLGQMMQSYESMGASFAACETNDDVLAVIEAFEEAMNAPTGEPTPEERQAAALEAIATGATSETTAVMEALLNGEG